MRVLSALAAAVVLHAFAAVPPVAHAGSYVSDGHVQASGYASVALEGLQDSTNTTTNTTTTNTTAPSTTTPTPTPSSNPSAVANVSDDEDSGGFIGMLRPGEVVEDVPGFVLLADASSPWTFKTGGNLLMGRALAAYDSAPPRVTVPCTTTDNLPDNSNFRVLIAVSTCFDNNAFQYIKSWVDSLSNQGARYFAGDSSSKVTFELRAVDDGCNAPSWTPAGGLVKDDDKKQYVAVISIMVFSKGCKTIQKFAANNKITVVIGYVYNGPSSVTSPNSPMISTTLPGYTPATWIDATSGFLSRFDPFGAMRKIHCSSMPDGVPTSYLENGKRKCFCSCPVGYELRGNACKATNTPTDPLTGDEDCTCAWSTKTDGYKILVTKYEPTGVCLFNKQAIKGTTGLLPVPVVVDNYVGHNRINTGDSVSPLGSSPRIELLNQRVAVKVTEGLDVGTEIVTTATPAKYSWQAFQATTSAVVDKLEFTHVGRYDITLRATDYGTDDATCPGCVLVIDTFRPTGNPTFQCPKPVNDVTSELTKDNINKVQKAANDVKAFKTNALNDPCSPNTRCDEDSFQTKKFTDKDYATPLKTLDGTTSFFDATSVKEDLKTRLAGTAFDTAQSDGVAAASKEVCERCIKLSTVLKEWWTDYKCGSAQASAKCEGSASCALTQCLTVNGATLATATASLKDSVTAASLAVVKAKGTNAQKTDTALGTEFALGTSVHIALECTKFPAANEPANPKCTYTSKVSDLITTSTAPGVNAAALADALFTAAEINGFVSWRYRVDGTAWRAWDTAPTETFAKTETTITVEAWTKCGQLKVFAFKVVLHLNSKIEVCEKFNDMWYQATRATPTRQGNVDVLCMHPKSDFAEVTFDYHPNIGLVGGAFEMTIAKVVCSLKYDGSPGNATIVDVGSPPPSSYEIVKEFSIDGVSVGMTKAETTVFVACQFTYKRKLDATTDTQVCNRKFVVKDCTPPKITKPCPIDGKCDFDKCAAAKPADLRPDLYQACGGNRITQTTDLKTTITTTEAQCCPSCDTQFYKTVCKSIHDAAAGATSTSDTGFIKRCEPESTTPAAPPPAGNAYGSYGAYGAYSVLEAAVSDIKETTSATTMTSALVGATAMVAAVAVVVVRRRQREVVMVDNDAYYPLMG